MNIPNGKAFLLAAVAMLFVPGLVAQPIPQLKPFTANMHVVSSGADKRDIAGKIYVGDGAMRMDMTGQGRGAAVITNFVTKTVDILMPERNMYIEHKASDVTGTQGPNFSDVRPYDPNNPCAIDADLTCKKLGMETIDGRACDHWELKHTNGTVANVWIDQHLHFPIKSVSQGSTFELTDILEGEPAADLFKVPAGYRKMEIGSGTGPAKQ